MQNITGSLSVMPVADIVQWANSSKRTGTLVLCLNEQHKKLYIQDGDIIYVWSDCDGAEFENILENQLSLDSNTLNKAYADSKLLGLPFISYLLSEGYFSKEIFEETVRKSTERVLIGALEWKTGLFEFVHGLPELLQDSPVRLSSFQVLLESTRHSDEGRRDERSDNDGVLNKIRQKIADGVVDLPPIPDVMQKISSKISDPCFSIDEIVSCITDQILVSKILKICNSPYYGRIGTVSNMKDAVIVIGLKSLLSIVTVHAMSSFSPRNEKEIRKVLQHSLVCGMIARQITRDIRGDFELAFICGLLHDIGKTILLDMLCDYKLQQNEQERLIKEHHAEVGYLLASKWNFGDDIKAVIRFHHFPEQAVGYVEIAEVISLANAMSHLNIQPEDIGSKSRAHLDLCHTSIDDMLEKVELFDNEAGEILSFT